MKDINNPMLNKAAENLQKSGTSPDEFLRQGILVDPDTVNDVLKDLRGKNKAKVQEILNKKPF